MGSSPWRTYLEEVFLSFDAKTKKLFLQRVGISRTSMLRWRNGEHTPKTEHLTRLLTHLPEEKSLRLLGLLQQDPRISQAADNSDALLFPAAPIPGSLYSAVFRLQRETGEDFWGLSSAILQHAVKQLAESGCGLQILLARCMPPGEHGLIQSLRGHICIGTDPWRTDLHEKIYFMGAESQTGIAVIQRHGIVIQDFQESPLFTSVHGLDYQQSAAAYPILRGKRVAGGLLVTSTRAQYFTNRRCAIIEAYADLLRLVFREQEFYPPELLNLTHLPSWPRQRPLMDDFHSRVDREHRRMLRQGGQVDRLQVERQVCACLEEEMFRMGSEAQDL